MAPLAAIMKSSMSVARAALLRDCEIDDCAAADDARASIVSRSSAPRS